MDLSRPFPNRAPTPARYTGIGLVIALHLAGIYALSVGMIKPPARERELATVKPLPPEVRELPPPEPLKAPRPAMTAPQPIAVPLPIFDVLTTQEPLISAKPLDTTPAVTTGPTRPPEVAPIQTVEKPRIHSPGAVCSVMPRPEVPAVNWSGEAVLQVIATVRGGRVVGSEVRMAQGAPDGKTRRSLQRSVESALAGYQCQGDAVFQQDFAFRLD
ncbi:MULTISPECIES: hypothetical protein [unclassified Roseateles]|uniref:hypothetical protein n=1 Tax=unclassified Roseateles TaxID=2626991 RepID=UPI0006F8C57A|nr:MULTISPECIES: hypothetical protein [unclassified Roseateles]KQW50777.1 hypothetical protein ASC81_24060 [Pelomonas sp. Root405]KRA70864.1 hypothetical protein ASD88_13555 [Pelomonas sp. Root662]